MPYSTTEWEEWEIRETINGFRHDLQWQLDNPLDPNEVSPERYQRSLDELARTRAEIAKWEDPATRPPKPAPTSPDQIPNYPDE